MADLGNSPQTKTSTSATSVMQETSPSISGTSQASKTHLDVSSTQFPTRAALLRFPVRVGITWKKGEKLEAMDFSRTWYPSKIVEIDDVEQTVLVHFEGWNQRYDEWVPMNSEKLRPCTRHSERKDKSTKKRRVLPHPVSDLPSIYRPGDSVLARWTDCKKYPAKVCRQMTDGAYEVVFFDGVSRFIQPINIQPMPEDMKDPLKTPPPPPPPLPREKIAFKNIKVTLPESFTKRWKDQTHRPRFSTKGGKMLATRKYSPMKSSEGSSSHLLPKRNPGFLNEKSKVTQSAVGLNRQAEEASASIECEATLSTLSESECIRMFGTTSSLYKKPPDIVVKDTQTLPEPVPPTSVPESVSKCKSIPTAVSGNVEPTSTSRTSSKGMLKKKKRRRNKSGTGLDFKLKPKHARKELLGEAPVKRQRILPVATVGQGLNYSGAGAIPGAAPLLPALSQQVFVPAKAFIVEEDHNLYKCPHDGCNKDFRKESLLNSHIKYYHTEPESPTTVSTATTTATGTTATVAASPTAALLPPSGHANHSAAITPSSRKRRKKTSSICSTDSDISVSSRGKASSHRRQRHDSDISINVSSPDLVGRDMWSDLKISISQVNLPEESLPVMYGEAEMEADVVNCVCGLRETNGLMIQCDVCMCWQHFSCVDKGTGEPPTTYVCLICENSSGARDSCRFLYDMGWDRRGELPTFPFIPESTTSGHLKSVACECNDMLSAIQGIKSSLHSTRRQIKISKEEGDPEFQLWQTDWDHWTKSEEDILTPYSMDPAPSPTPSAFLFPSNSAVRATTAVKAEITTVAEGIISAASPVAAASSSVTTTVASTPPASSAILSPDLLNQESANFSVPTSQTLETKTRQVSLLPSTTDLSSRSQAKPSISVATTSPSVDSQSAECLSPPISHLLPHLPPSTPRSGTLPSIQGKARNLIKDLFPGPAGDAPVTPAMPDVSKTSYNIKFSAACPDGHPPDVETQSSWRAEVEDSRSSALIDEKENTLIPSSTDRDVSGPCPQLKVDSKSRNVMMKPPASSTQGSSSTCASLLPPLQCDMSSSQSLLHSSSTTEFTHNNPALHTSTDDTAHTEQSAQNTDSAVSTSKTQEKSTVGLDLVNTGEDNFQVTESSNGQASQEIFNSTEDASCNGHHEDKPGDKKNLWSKGGEPAGGVGSTCGKDSLYIEVNEDGSNNLNGYDVEDKDDNDTDTAEESADLYRHCERHLLVHVTQVHSAIEKQLDMLEQQIIELETSEHNDPTIHLSEENVLNDLPALKKSLSKLALNMSKIQRLSMQQ